LTNDADRLDEAMAGLLTPLLAAMDALAQAGRGMHPQQAVAIAGPLRPYRQPVADGLATVAEASWPAGTAVVRDACFAAATAIVAGLDELAAARDAPEVYRALRRNTLAQEALYPAAAALPQVSRFFLPAERRDDAALLARLARPNRERDDLGVSHAGNERAERGGCSVYVPEYWDGERALPLVIALHGGSGHGRDFLWSWLKAARAAGVAVLSPTSVDRTWSLVGPDLDSGRIGAAVEAVAARYRIDRARVLLTGMSDGGTFASISGVLGTLPATHLAPVAAYFHPPVLDFAPPGRLEGLPVYVVHGALDWMFPVAIARAAREALQARGARVEYREIADLGHAYPREENPRILDWFLGGQG
jgi:phospholipase/carboxylesterase